MKASPASSDTSESQRAQGLNSRTREAQTEASNYLAISRIALEGHTAQWFLEHRETSLSKIESLKAG